MRYLRILRQLRHHVRRILRTGLILTRSEYLSTCWRRSRHLSSMRRQSKLVLRRLLRELSVLRRRLVLRLLGVELGVGHEARRRIELRIIRVRSKLLRSLLLRMGGNLCRSLFLDSNRGNRSFRMWPVLMERL